MQQMTAIDSIEKKFSRAASNYDHIAHLQDIVGQRLLQRLQLVKIAPKTVLDLGCGTGKVTKLLKKHYPKAQVFALDLALPMLEKARQRYWPWVRPAAIQADMAQLPFAAQSLDIVFAHFVVHWHQDHTQLFQELRRVLKPGGLVIFSTVGPDSLKELRQAWQAVDNYAHVNTFIDMHDLGDVLLHAQFVDPVMEMEYFCLTYKDTMSLMRELKASGASHIHQARTPHLMGKNRLQQCAKAYESFRNEQGKLPVTYEIVYGHAFVPAASDRAHANAQGEVNIPLSAIRKRRG